MTMRGRVWITPEVVSWTPRQEAGWVVDQSALRRGYTIWQHASDRLKAGANEMDRADAITTLKRCLNQRLRVIEAAYKLRRFLRLNNTRYLEALSQLGLARPMLIQHLLKVRNAIEHEDKAPPRLRRCLEMLDVVWYFLRTTDRLVGAKTHMFILEPDETSRYGLEVEVVIKRVWTASVRGWLPHELLSYSPIVGCFGVRPDKLQAANSWKKQGQHLDKLDTDIYLSGSVTEIPDKIAFARAYFEAH